MRLDFRTPSEDDIAHVGANMRAIDALECRTVTSLEPEAALRDAVRRSDWSLAAVVITESGWDVPCIFGVGADDETLLGEGFPWLLGTDALTRHARFLLARSPFYIEAMLHRYERLRNVVHADNAASVRWLAWLGFEFGERIEVRGEPFLPFELARR